LFWKIGLNSFLALSADQRARAIATDFAPRAFTTHDSLTFGRATLGGTTIHLLGQDARFEGGSFGVAESDAVTSWLQGVTASPAPIIFALDSGGARMSEGLAALGGFRRMFRAAAEAWLAGVPMLFVCGKTVFGGASMLASLGDHRVYFERSLFGMSGPRIVQAVAGAADFNAEDKAFVASIMGGAARARREGNALVADDGAAVREFCLQWALHCVHTLRAGINAFPSNTLARLQAELIAHR
jgi:acetyl-CoA carboxylase carboxyltransferase component